MRKVNQLFQEKGGVEYMKHLGELCCDSAPFVSLVERRLEKTQPTKQTQVSKLQHISKLLSPNECTVSQSRLLLNEVKENGFLY